MTHGTKARSPDLNLVSQLMDINVTNLKPKAQQEAGPDCCPRHIDVRSDDLDFQDFTSSAFGPEEVNHDAADNKGEELIGKNAHRSDNWSYTCPLCKKTGCRPQQHNAQMHLVNRQEEWVIETWQESSPGTSNPTGQGIRDPGRLSQVSAARCAQEHDQARIRDTARKGFG